ncbi:MAG: CAP domain-containing protein, partial [Tepidisphaeraceae bacterium]
MRLLQISQFETLEPRRLLAAVFPSNAEQLMVELINRARAKPATEASRFGIDLNEGLSPGTISTSAKQPLAINPFLTDAARKHSKWMLDNDIFSHTGAAGSNPRTRMTSAGYVFGFSGSGGENIAYRGKSSSVPELTSTTIQLHQDLFVDKDINLRGHRKNMLDNVHEEIGAGVQSGVFTTSNAVMLTTDFAYTNTSSFLTGVAFSDAITADSFYTVGEGIAGVTITATRTTDKAVFSTTTWSSGGYSLKLSPGVYN